MPRVSEIRIENLPAEARTALERRSYSKLGAPSWELVTGHCPHVMTSLISLMGAFGSHGTMPRRYIEIAVVTVSRLNACRHCVGRHSVRLAELGLAHETMAAILDQTPPGLDAVDLLVRDYALAVSQDATRIRDRVFDALREHFDEAQIVELTWRIALGGAFNRFNNAMQVDLDEGHLNALLAQGGQADDLPSAPRAGGTT